MILKQSFFTLFLIVSTHLLQAQIVSDNQILRLEEHPMDSSKFIAKIYNNQTGKLEEYWEMAAYVPEISIDNFNELVQERAIEPQGKYYILYENMNKKLEVNYDHGTKIGETKGYYETGELYFQGNYVNGNLEGKLTHFYKDGTIEKEETFVFGMLDETVCFYPSGNLYMETDYANGVKNGKQIIYYPNGKPKRETKYKMHELVSEKCFDNDGKKTECSTLITEPSLVDGKDQFLKNFSTYTFNNDETQNDTILLKINLKIDTSGQAQFVNFDFTIQDSLQTDLINWIQKPGLFTPMLFDKKPVECNINLILPIFQNKVLLSNDFTKQVTTTRNNITHESEETYYWNFSSIDDNVYFTVDKMPEFPGGEMALRKFIADNIQYPVLAQKNGIQGKVFVTFTIDKSGLPVDIKVARGVYPLLNDEAMRVVSAMPKWSPGMLNGTPVCVSMTAPINFILQNGIRSIR